VKAITERVQSGHSPIDELQKAQADLNAAKQELEKARQGGDGASNAAPKPAVTPPATNETAKSDQDKVIARAKEQLEDVRKRVAVGVMAPIDESFAQMELAIAEARGNALKIADAKVLYHEQWLNAVEIRFRSGSATNADMQKAVSDLRDARIEQESARIAAPRAP
jgi:outer membrane protein TolC